VLEVEGIAGSDRCVHKGQEREIVWLPTPKRGEDAGEETLEYALPCGFDWVNEPSVLGRTGKPMKRKPPPKKCTRGCRNYAPVAPPESGDITPYTDEQIREIEMDILGAYLSSTPFDRIPEEDRDQFATAAEILTGPLGSYPIAAVINGVRTAQKRDDMGFLTLATERGTLSCVVFPKLYEKHRHQFKKGSLVYATVTKTQRGQTLDLFMPIDD
jgi:DNA polymerase-3 subunit alpha